MQPRTKLLSAGVALVGLTALAATGLSYVPNADAQSAHLTKASMMGGHHGWGRHGGSGFGRLCGEQRTERVEHMIGFVEAFMTFTPPQQQAWDNLTATLRDSDTKVGQACEQQKAQGDATTAPEKLARMETMMTTGLQVVQQVRPAFDGFYATLNERQQKALDEMLQHRHHRGEPPKK